MEPGDAYYLSDWGGCTCDPEVNYFDPDCPLFDGEEHGDE